MAASIGLWLARCERGWIRHYNGYANQMMNLMQRMDFMIFVDWSTIDGRSYVVCLFCAVLAR